MMHNVGKNGERNRDSRSLFSQLKLKKCLDVKQNQSQRNTDADKNFVTCDICGKVFKKKSIMKNPHR